MQETRRTRSHEEWKELIREQQNGEQTIKDFCRERNLALHSFHYHKKRMHTDAGGFLEIRGAESGLRIKASGASWTLEVDRDFDPVCLKRVLQVLSA